jgi:hypothetical protein
MDRIALALIITMSAPAFAQEEPEKEPTPEQEAAAQAAARIRALERKLRDLEDEVGAMQDDAKFNEQRIEQVSRLAARFSGYLDTGFFVTGGNGAGTRTDLAQVYFPEYDGIVPGSWVFMGDPLSTAVNGRGEPADTGDSRAVVYDSINSGGNATFLVNAFNLAVLAGLGETASVTASTDLVPRARDISDPAGVFTGDFIDVKLAYAEWKPTLERFELALQAGKFDSVLGFEYRSLESPDRTTVTPSLICRYTCGRPIGVKARAKLGGEKLVLNLAVTNGSHFSEGFPFSSETDTNQWKTVAGRVSTKVKMVELGASGAYGAQDFQMDEEVRQWHAGADLHLDWKDVEVTAEYVKGRAKGATSMVGPPCDLAPCLRYEGFYGLVAYRLGNQLIPYARVDYRDALHRSGASFVYISDLVRATVGLRAELGTSVILKAEYTLNRELERIPQFPNDVFTTSMIAKF